jgi:lysozyme
MMRLSDKGRDCIIKREAIRLKSYLCTAGRWTIGIGHTAGVKPGMTITVEQAYKYFEQDIKPVEDYLNYINDRLKKKFLQHEYDALVSFIHQIGLTYFAASTCLRKIRHECSAEEIASEFPRWCYVTKTITENGKIKKVKVIDEGVRNRHLDEKRQYLRGY